MVWILFVLAAAAIVVLTAAAVAGRFTPDPMATPVTSTPHHGLPDGTLHAEDVDGLHFDTALRGYRMDQVDEVIDRLQQRIAQLEEDARER